MLNYQKLIKLLLSGVSDQYILSCLEPLCLANFETLMSNEFETYFFLYSIV